MSLLRRDSLPLREELALVEPPIRREDYNSFSSVYRAAGTDPKQRRWFVFEPALVLPEYLVEVEYLPARRAPEREPSPAQLAELGGVLFVQPARRDERRDVGLDLVDAAERRRRQREVVAVLRDPLRRHL